MNITLAKSSKTFWFCELSPAWLFPSFRITIWWNHWRTMFHMSRYIIRSATIVCHWSCGRPYNPSQWACCGYAKYFLSREDERRCNPVLKSLLYFQIDVYRVQLMHHCQPQVDKWQILRNGMTGNALNSCVWGMVDRDGQPHTPSNVPINDEPFRQARRQEAKAKIFQLKLFIESIYTVSTRDWGSQQYFCRVPQCGPKIRQNITKNDPAKDDINAH